MLDNKHFWVRQRHEVLLSTIERFIVPNIHRYPSPAPMLDIGSGNGKALQYLSKKLQPFNIVVHGSDLTTDKIDKLRITFPGVLVTLNVSHLSPIFDNCYPVISLLDVLEHVDDVVALNQIHSTLYDKGYLILTVPAYPWMWSRFDVMSEHQRRYTKGSLRRVLEGSGFTVTYISYFLTALFPLLVAARLSNRLLRRPALAGIELHSTIPILNEGIYQVERLERRISQRLSPPYGCSIIAVARKK